MSYISLEDIKWKIASKGARILTKIVRKMPKKVRQKIILWMDENLVEEEK